MKLRLLGSGLACTLAFTWLVACSSDGDSSLLANGGSSGRAGESAGGSSSGARNNAAGQSSGGDMNEAGSTGTDRH